MNYPNGWCNPDIVVYDKTERESSVLDHNGEPFIKKEKSNKLGFDLTRRDNEPN